MTLYHQAKYKNNARAWRQAEEDTLVDLRVKGYKWYYVAQKLGRSESACRCRYSKVLRRERNNDPV